jgi:3',5'-cyclic AMP phosphodiesterase CpdA
LKIAIISDTHFGARNDNQNIHDYFYKFYDDVFFPTLVENGELLPVFIWVMLQTVGSSSALKLPMILERKFINRFSELGIDLHIIIGNHDTFYKNTNEVNSMEELVGSDRCQHLHWSTGCGI